MIIHSVRWISKTHLVKNEDGYYIPKVVISGNYFIRWGEWKPKKKGGSDVESDTGNGGDLSNS